MNPIDFPKPVRALIGELKSLPGIGPRSAERIAVWLLQSPKADCPALAGAVLAAKEAIRPCPVCGFFATASGCELCDDTKRDERMLCVVEQATDVIPLERSGAFKGRYHCLGGKLSPLDRVSPEDLRIPALLRRIEEAADEIEVVLALGAEMLVVGGIETDRELARARCEDAVTSGNAAKVFGRMTAALGGPADFVENHAKYLPQAPVVRPVHADGVLAEVDARAVGNAIIELGGGRRQVGETLDLSVGFTQIAAAGTRIDSGRPLAVSTTAAGFCSLVTWLRWLNLYVVTLLLSRGSVWTILVPSTTSDLGFCQTRPSSLVA